MYIAVTSGTCKTTTLKALSCIGASATRESFHDVHKDIRVRMCAKITHFDNCSNESETDDTYFLFVADVEGFSWFRKASLVIHKACEQSSGDRL